ncbi:MAG: Ig-like domain-containing protein [Clostridia bacterium]|nr:Ig-like domain-containing protein [Clostridia bacterium]
MKKRFTAILLSFVLALSTLFISACDGVDPGEPPTPPTPPQPQVVYAVNYASTLVRLDKGQSTTPSLIFTADGENADVSLLTFTSDDTTVATVNASGQITAVGAGYANVTASIGEGENAVSDTIGVSVTAYDYTVVANPKSYSIVYGETVALTAMGYLNGDFTADSGFAWSSADPTIAEIVNGSYVKGRGEGQTTLTVNYLGATDTVTVSVGVPEFNILLSETSYLVDSQKPLTVPYTAMAGTNVDDRPEITWHIADTSVATVNDGVIVGLKDGTTTLTANYHGATDTATIKVVKTVSATEINAFNEDYINIYGRTYLTDNKLTLEHVSNGVEVAILGNQLSLNATVTASLYVRIYIDGVEQDRINFTPSVSNYLVATNITNDYHTIRIVKTSENFVGKIYIESFVAPAFAIAKQPAGPRIEFIGDSITAGYGALQSGSSWSDVGSDGTQSYSYQTAKRLNATYSIIARQGICVKKLMWTNYNMYDNFYPYVSKDNQTAYSFNFNPDVVVLALGTNDASYMSRGGSSYETGAYSQAQFATDYKNMLTLIRQKNPNAYIVCIYGMMGKLAGIDGGISDAVSAFGDSKVSYINDWVADANGQNGHPHKNAHAGYADKLAAYISNLLK